MNRRNFFSSLLGLLAAPFVPAVAAKPRIDGSVGYSNSGRYGNTPITGSAGVVLPAATPGTVFIIENRGTTPITVFPTGIELKRGETFRVKNIELVKNLTV